MFDIHLLRSQPEHAAASLLRRGFVLDVAYCIDREDKRKRIQTRIEQRRAEKNRIVKLIAQHKDEPVFIKDAKSQVTEINQELSGLEQEFHVLQEEWEAFALGLPNLLHSSVPDGQSEADNVVIRLYGDPRVFHFPVLDHVALSEGWGIDLPRASKITGARFSVLYDEIARLHRALAQFMLDTHHRHGYREVSAPFIVHRDSLLGTGQLPKFEEDLFALRGEAPWYLVPTAEVSVTNLFRQEILASDMLPMSFVSVGACFRSEAGSAGRDTRGIFRQHQFEKVELVKIVPPELSYDALEIMTQDAERILRLLEIPYRVMLLCSADTGFSAAKTYDIEVWIPSQETYREISSCSNCEAFQARRMKLRYRSDKGIASVHTLNGSALAVGRTLIAVMENYQQADGSIVIPSVLRPYMGGQAVIASRRTAVLDQ